MCAGTARIGSMRVVPKLPGSVFYEDRPGMSTGPPVFGVQTQKLPSTGSCVCVWLRCVWLRLDPFCVCCVCVWLRSAFGGSAFACVWVRFCVCCVYHFCVWASCAPFCVWHDPAFAFGCVCVWLRLGHPAFGCVWRSQHSPGRIASWLAFWLCGAGIHSARQPDSQGEN